MAIKRVNAAYRSAGQTITNFHLSNAHIRVLVGPLGSGKTKACIMESMRRMLAQAPDANGRRKVRVLVTRSTYPELMSSTIPDWRTVFVPEISNFTLSPIPRQEIRFKAKGPDGKPDGTVVDAEVFFMAFDSADAAESLRSTEFTFAWMNEMRQFEKPVLDMITGRLRYAPNKLDATWLGVIGDTQPPDRDHWLYTMLEDKRPDNFAVFRQPPAVLRDDKGRWHVNPAAENLANIRPSGEAYYRNILAGKTDDWILVNLANEYGYVIDGKPVYPEWRDSVHVAKEAIEPIKRLPLFIGFDWGLSPAAVIAQRTARGQWLVIDELVGEDMGARRFAGLLAGRLAQWYPDFKYTMWGDPAGTARSQTDEQTCFEIVKDQIGQPVREAPSQDPVLRREAVSLALNRMVDGLPGFQLSPACPALRKGFAGGYRFRRLKVSGEERYHDVPEKNRFSHPHDALQYLMLGAGEGAAVLGRAERDLALSQAPAECEGDYAVLGA